MVTTPTVCKISSLTMGEDKGTKVERNHFRFYRKKIQWFGCAVCKTKFKEKDDLYAHINQLHTDEFPFPCTKCPKRFGDASQLKTHSGVHDPTRYQGEPGFCCEFCGKRYHLKISLVTHRKLKHLGYNPPKKGNASSSKMILPRNKKQIPEPVKCSQNSITILEQMHDQGNPLPTSVETDLKNIIQLPKQTVSCVCTECNITLPSQLEFLAHLNTVHGDARRFPCHHCGKKFASAVQRRVHETIHNPHRFKGEPKFACNLCDKKYHIKGTLDSHKLYAHLGRKRPSPRKKFAPLKRHHSIGVKRPEPEVKPTKPLYECSQCDLKFDYRFKLKKHLKCHSDERSFKCDVCQQTFVHRNSLRTHTKRIHENASKLRHLAPTFMYKQKKSWDCPHCPRQFSLPSKLQAHLTVHTGELPHQCPSCEMRFRTTGGLRTHEKVHISNHLNTFKCRICGREGFKRFNDFNAHRKYSHDQYPYQRENEKAFGCGICGKPYFTRENAIICALLKHDPTSLREQMFRTKCSACPENCFGHRSLLALRNHWKVEHGDKPIPAKYRAGMYNSNLKHELPSVTLDKVKAREIKEKGIPSEVKYEFPLYIEFDLLEITPEGKEFQCSICNKIFGNERNLKSHHMNIHVKGGKERGERQRLPRECDICQIKFVSGSNLRRHLLSKQHLFNVEKSANAVIKYETYERFESEQVKMESEIYPDFGFDHDAIEMAPVIVSVDASVKQEVESIIPERNGSDEWLDVSDVQVKMEPIEAFEIQGYSVTFENEEVGPKTISRKPRNKLKSFNTVATFGVVKRKRGRPIGTKKKKLSTSAPASNPKIGDDNLRMDGVKNACFICGFQAASVIILRRHLMAQHIDRNETGNCTSLETCTSVKADEDGNKSNDKFPTVNVNDLEEIKMILGNKELRLILTRVDDDCFDFSDMVFLNKVC